MKTPEEMAEEYVAHNRSYPYDPLNAQDRYMRNSYLVGYETCRNHIHLHWKEEWKDLYKRIEESSLPAMDAMEGRYLRQVKELEAAIPRWISVKEREPADETWVLGTNGRDIECVFKHDTDCYSMTTITHWMPLPEPPKDE